MIGRWRAVGLAVGLALSMTMAVAVAPSAAQETADPPPGQPAAERWAALAARSVTLFAQAQYDDAADAAEQSLWLALAAFGFWDANTASSLSNLGSIQRALGDPDAALPLFRQSAAINRVVLGPTDANARYAVEQLGRVLIAVGRPADGEAVLTAHVADMQAAGFVDARLVPVIVQLAELASARGDDDRAGDRYRQAIAAARADPNTDTAYLASFITDFGTLLEDMGRFDDAERAYRDVVALREAGFGPDSAETADALNALGLLLHNTGQMGAAHAIHRRALAIREAIFGPDHHETAVSLNNVALVLYQNGDYAAAEPMFRRSLAIGIRDQGEESQSASRSMNNLALTLAALGRSQEASELFRRALHIDRAVLGPDHLDVAIAQSNLAGQLVQLGGALGFVEALSLYQQTTALYERVLGPHHPSTGSAYDDEALMLVRLGDHERAAGRFAQAVRAYTAARDRDLMRRSSAVFVAAAANAVRLGPDQAAHAFRTVQWALGGSTEEAISAMTNRIAAGEPALARLLRAQQDAAARIEVLNGTILDASARGAAEEANDLRAARDALEGDIAQWQAEIGTRFPDVADLAGADPVAAQDVAALLADGEALVLIAPGPQRRFDEASHGTIFAVLPDGTVHAAQLETGYDGLADDAARLTCAIAGDGPDCASVMQDARGAVPMNRDGGSPAGFDLDLAHAIHDRTLGRLGDALDGADHLIVVAADSALAGLPLQMLVTAPPDPGLTGRDALRGAQWLIRDHAVTTLPSVAALRALRGRAHAAQPGTRAFLGVGDPVIGEGDAIVCARDMPQLVATLDAGLEQAFALRAAGGSTAGLFGAPGSGGVPVADVEAVRALTRLPDTRCELERVADSLGGGTLLMDEGATEAAIKEANARGELADYRVISFATHGLVAGEAGALEPALVLTPPAIGSVADDGLLTASEVAALDLNADWVLLSACNTAAGDGADGETLSGLARAFFYAGARSVLVSHWPVNSFAAVRLTTTAFAVLEDDPAIGRAEALRRSMLAIIDDPASTERHLHPRYWAPFSLVGEGARSL